MSDINPIEIIRRYERKELDRATAVGYLKSIIESGSTAESRVRSVELLGKFGLDKPEDFKFLENLVTSETDENVRLVSVGIIVDKFLEEAEDLLKWVFKNEKSADCLLDIYNALASCVSGFAKDILYSMEETIGMNKLIQYDLLPKEAMALELLGRHLCAIEHIYKQKEWIFNGLKVKNNHVFSLEIEMSYNKINSKFFSLFSNLQKLRLFDCELTDYYCVRNLSSLLITGTEEGHINSIYDLKGLETLTNLKVLNLSGNRISEIKNLENLINLMSLNLSENNIIEIEGLDTLVQLEVLNLEHNNLEEIKNLDHLKNLRELDLSQNQNIPEIKGLSNLRNLEVLKLSNNYLISEIKGLCNLINLRILDISKDGFMLDKKGYALFLNARTLISEHRDVKEIISYENQKNREVLEKYRGYIKEIKGLSNLSNLRELYLEGNQINEIKALENLRKLEILDLRFNKIKEIKGLENLKKLKTLRLVKNNICQIKGLEGIENDLGVSNPQKFVDYCDKKKRFL